MLRYNAETVLGVLAVLGWIAAYALITYCM